MRINNNMTAVNAQRHLSITNSRISRKMEKLSSGLRINRVADDAAGLSISEKMRAQIRGLRTTSKNAQDGISMIQTAEGAMNEVHALLHRMRELAIQADNDTNTETDKGKLQDEVNEIINEVDRIATTTEFNTRKLLDGSLGTQTNGVVLTSEDELKLTIIKGLKSGWLEEGTKMINTLYGLNESTRTIDVIFDTGTPGGNLASIQTQYSILGDTATVTNMELHVDLSDFTPSTGEHGENTMTTAGGTMYNDRIIAHEVIHVIMADAKVCTV